MTEYVAGFMFNWCASEVVLIHKQKPEWQKNRFNAVGGKVEIGELPISAMVREFSEETGVTTIPSDWFYFCQYNWQDGIVHFYKALDTNNTYIPHIQTTTDEDIYLIELDKLHDVYDTIYNLKWLIPLALDPSLQSGKVVTVNE